MTTFAGIEVPPTLSESYKRWKKVNYPRQVDSRWNINSWLRQLGEHESILTTFPQKAVGRDEGIEMTGKVENREHALRAFLLAMIWGYGPVGYGPYRTRRVLDSADALDRLLHVGEIAQTSGGLAAFKHIEAERRSDRGYLKFLGPAFGTKYLFFLTSAMSNVETTPVMDAVVVRWFRKNVPGAALSVNEWDSESYEKYLTYLKAWSHSLPGNGAPLDVGDVEYLIFATGANFERNLEWSEEWHDEAPSMLTSDLLDHLRAMCKESDTATLSLINELEEQLSPVLDQIAFTNSITGSGADHRSR